MKENKWGFTSQQASSLGKHVVSSLTEALWFLDPFWDRFKSRGIVPKPLIPMTGYRDLKNQKKKIPKVTLKNIYVFILKQV